MKWGMTRIDLYDIRQSRFESDRDYAKLQGQGFDWFSSSGVRLRIHVSGTSGGLTTCTNSLVLTNFVVNTSPNTYEIKVNLRSSRF